MPNKPPGLKEARIENTSTAQAWYWDSPGGMFCLSLTKAKGKKKDPGIWRVCQHDGEYLRILAAHRKRKPAVDQITALIKEHENQKGKPKAAKKKARTASMEDRAKAAMIKTWNIIYPKVAGMDDFGDTVDEIVAAVLDVDCWEVFGNDPEAVEWFEQLTEEQQDELAYNTLKGFDPLTAEEPAKKATKKPKKKAKKAKPKKKKAKAVKKGLRAYECYLLPKGRINLLLAGNNHHFDWMKDALPIGQVQAKNRVEARKLAKKLK